MILTDLSTRKRHDTLWLALGFVLQDLTEVANTAAVAERLGQRLGFPASEGPMVTRWLVNKAAPLTPEASHTGEPIRIYGNRGRRWLWSPRGGAKAPVVRSGLEARLNAAGVVDTSDW